MEKRTMDIYKCACVYKEDPLFFMQSPVENWHYSTGPAGCYIECGVDKHSFASGIQGNV